MVVVVQSLAPATDLKKKQKKKKQHWQQQQLQIGAEK
jgi:hypothetical protein